MADKGPMEHTFSTPVRAPRSRTSVLNGSISEDPSFIHIPASPFMTQVGYGTGVSVYLFERSPKSGFLRSPWAVKKLKAGAQFTGFDNIEERLEKEAALLKELKHESIIGFRAFTKSADGTLCLSMENGEKCLHTLIEERCDTGELGPFPAKDILKTALTMAKALAYIHVEHNILHGDLKSGNVLIKGDFESIKLCDFGVSVKLNDDLSGVKDESECYIGTEPWNAKEVFTDGKITDKTDIFAYGLILWEMLALTIPHTELLDFDDSTGEGEADFNESGYYEALGTRPALPDWDYGDEYVTVLELFALCSNEDPTMRPTALQIVDMLTID